MVMQGAHHDLPWVDAGLRQGAAKHLFQRDQPVLRIEKQNGEHLVRPRGQVQLQVLADSLRCSEYLALFQSLGQRAACQFQHGRQFGALGCTTQALDALQVFESGVEQAGDAAKGVKQFLRQLQHVLADHTGAQQQRQQFDIAQGNGAAGHEFFARPGFGRQILEGHCVASPAGRGNT